MVYLNLHLLFSIFCSTHISRAYSYQESTNTKTRDIGMTYIEIIVQVTIALGIYNVWLLRFGKATSWRGGTAQNMKEEFAAYGLPPTGMYVVGFFKLTFATMLLIGIALPSFVPPAALGMTLLMVGAIVMHVKVSDPLKRSLPAAIMLGLSLVVLL
jgi:uncharacterized membrane protein YphA (DoxX/SURF4 family)